MCKSAKSTDPCSAPLWIILTFTLNLLAGLGGLGVVPQSALFFYLNGNYISVISWFAFISSYYDTSNLTSFVKIRSAKLAFWNVFYCTCITAILHHWKKNVFARWYTWPWTLKHCGPEGKLTVSAFILPNANALLAFRIFSWKLVFMHNSPFNVNGKLLNLSSTNLPWEQQKSYVLLFDLYSSAKCKLLHALHSFSLSSNGCFSTFPLLAAKSFVSCCTL